MTDPTRGSELPPATSDPNIAGKRVAHNLGPLVGPDGEIASTAPSDPSLDVPALVGTAAGLAMQAERLADEVMGLRTAADSLAKRARRNEWVLALTSIGLVLDIALSVFAFILLSNQSTSNARLETSIREQCSLYALILPSYSDTAKQKSPLGPAGYDSAFRRMQVSADNLNCGIPHRI